MAGSFDSLSPDEVCDFLKKQIPSISDSIFQKIKEHKIDGEVFLELTDEYLREIAPLLGDRLKLKRAIATALARTSTPISDSSSPSPSSFKSCTPARLTSTPSRMRSLSPHSSVPESAYTQNLDSDSEDTDADLASLSHGSTVLLESDGVESRCPGSSQSSSSTLSGTKGKEEPTSKLPEPALDWAEHLTLPTRFSKETTGAIESGILTKKARVEIHNAVATLMLVYTSRPTSNDRDIVCRRLIQKYPTLKDSSDSGCASWKEMLRTKFKNLRRPARAEKAGIAVPPPLKKAKRVPVTVPTFTESDAAEYKRHVEYLKHTYNSKKWSLSGMQILLQQTSEQRRNWIQNEGPSVKAVFDMFPCFADPRIMLSEFCLLTGANEDSIKRRWTRCQERVLKYAPLEQKKVVKELLREMNITDRKCEEQMAVYTVLLLMAFLNIRVKGQAILTVIEGEALDIQQELQTLETKAPFIVGFGATRASASDFKVVIETENVLPMPSVVTALHYCFAAYYVFNMSFPPDYRFVLLFLEKYVYGLKPSQKLPMCVTVLIDSLERVLQD